MRKILTSFAFIAASLTFAQVGVNNEDPKATLHIDAKEKAGASTIKDGILIPRVDRQRAENMVGVEESTLIYIDNENAGNKTGQAANIDEKGFYYFKGGVWVKLGGGAAGVDTSIYAADGNVGENRVVTQGDNNITFAMTKSTDVKLGGRFILDGDKQNNGAVYVDYKDPTNPSDTGNLRVNNTDDPSYEKTDYMVIFTNKDISGKLLLPPANENVGRVMHLINGTTRGLNFASGDQYTRPFNFSTIGVRGSSSFVSTGDKWYPLTY